MSVADVTGRAVVVHAGRDNYGNIPDHYSSDAEGAPASGPDAMTLAAVAASREGFPHRADTVILPLRTASPTPRRAALSASCATVRCC